MYDGESRDEFEMNGLRQAVTVRSFKTPCGFFYLKKGQEY